MKEFIKSLLQLFFRPARLLNRRKVVVLAYHEVRNESLFEKQLEFILRYYNPITIEDFVLFVNGKKELPEYALLITFDDGDPSVRNKAMPLLQKYGIPATAFIISENVELQMRYWWKVVEEFYKANGHAPALGRKQVNRLKSVPNAERLREINSIVEKIPALLRDPETLSPEDLFVMERAGITIGSHTATHPILNNCTEDELEREFSESKKFFIRNGLPNYKYFAYPNGDYDSRLIPILKKSGIEIAFTFNHKLVDSRVNRYAVNRIRANAHDSIYELKLRVSGLSTILNRNK